MIHKRSNSTFVGSVGPDPQLIEWNGHIYVLCPTMPVMIVKDGKLVPVKLD